MPAMQIIETTSAQWGVFVFMRGVLLQAGTQHKTQQTSGSINACSHREVPRQPWPGAHLGVRQADPDETPLSESECWIAVREGLT